MTAVPIPTVSPRERKERPILFSAPMVRAILDGQKTQTRRLVVDEQIERADECVFVANGYAKMARPLYVNGPPPGYVQTNFAWNVRCPYGQAGDRLWVRETHQILDAVGVSHERAVVYRAHCADDCVDLAVDGGIARVRIERWRPAIHMPRWASRITLEVTAVRVERLQDITEADILAEGCTCDVVARMTNTSWSDLPTLHHAWERAWDFINEERAPWASNPWVWCVSFKRIETAAESRDESEHE